MQRSIRDGSASVDTAGEVIVSSALGVMSLEKVECSLAESQRILPFVRCSNTVTKSKLFRYAAHSRRPAHHSHIARFAVNISIKRYSRSVTQTAHHGTSQETAAAARPQDAAAPYYLSMDGPDLAAYYRI